MAIKWERTRLPKGAYRVSGAKVLDRAPDTTGYEDCSYDEQFLDELISIKAALGISAGVIWAGFVLHGHGPVSEVLALLLE